MTSSRAVSKLREDARDIFLAGVAAADPRRAVIDAIQVGPKGGVMVAGAEICTPASLGIVAVGKASLTMAAAALEVVPRALLRTEWCSIVVNLENAAPLEPFRVFASGHPLPDEIGVRAARHVEDSLRATAADDGILLLLSGGGSALLPAPGDDVTLDDKRAVTELLLGGGADIHEINTVRKHLSRLKGGGMARAALPAAMEVLILSDVFDDDLSSIASGPTVADPTTFGAAISILRHYELWPSTPAAVKTRLEAGEKGGVPETPEKGDAAFERVRNTIIGSNVLSLEAARRQAESLGYAVEMIEGPLTGEAREAAQRFVSQLDAAGEPSLRAFVAGGETTVTVRGGGKGGRNQEMALAVATAAAAGATRGMRQPTWVFLSGGTDGRDGPTDAAGGLVDAGTVRRGKHAGEDPQRALDDNDSYTFLKACGDLLITGPTGTNVADLQVLLYAQ